MPYGDTTSVEIERIATGIVNASFTVHQKTGPGLLESVYEAFLAVELRKRGFTVARQVVVPLVYDGVELEEGFRIDLLVNDLVIIEVKAVEKMIPIFEAQVLTYLKLKGKRLAFLINFNVTRIKDGLQRVIL